MNRRWIPASDEFLVALLGFLALFAAPPFMDWLAGDVGWGYGRVTFVGIGVCVVLAYGAAVGLQRWVREKLAWQRRDGAEADIGDLEPKRVVVATFGGEDDLKRRPTRSGIAFDPLLKRLVEARSPELLVLLPSEERMTSDVRDKVEEALREWRGVQAPKVEFLPIPANEFKAGTIVEKLESLLADKPNGTGYDKRDIAVDGTAGTGIMTVSAFLAASRLGLTYQALRQDTGNVVYFDVD